MRAIAFLALLVACKPTPVEWTRAGDASYAYQPVQEGVALGLDGGAMAKPSVTLIVGDPGGRGDLDGVGREARLGRVGGMVRVGDAIIFADEGNGTIRQFVPKTETVTTLARLEHPAGFLALPAHLAYDGAQRVFITDRGTNVVRVLDLATKSVSVFAGHAGERGDADGNVKSALFDTPTGIAFDGDHTLWVADTGTRRIRRIDIAAGTVSTLGGDPWMQVWGLCFDGSSLFASDSLRASVYRVDKTTGGSELITGSNRFGYAGPGDGAIGKGRLREPHGITCDNGRILVADRGNGAVRTVDVKAKSVSTVAGRRDDLGSNDGDADHARFGDPQSVLPWGDTIYVGDEATIRAINNSIVRTVAGSPDQAAIRGFSPTVRRVMAHPRDVVASLGENAAYVGTCGTGVFRVDLATQQATPFVGAAVPGFMDGAGLEAMFGCVSGIAHDGRGNLFVADAPNHAIRGIRIDTREVVTIAGTLSRCGNDDGDYMHATFCNPSGVAYGDDALYVTDSSAQTIRRIDLVRRVVSTLAGLPFERGAADGGGQAARFSSPSGIAFQNGVLYVADRENHSIRRVTLTGEVSTFAGLPQNPGAIDGPLAQARFDRPTALGVSGDALLVTDRSSVRRIAAGTVTRVVGAGAGLHLGSIDPSLSQPGGIADLGSGEMLVVDRAENSLVRVAAP